jgi:NAD(P)-dependent dehydrogenase (short-subunit alcohol dehydrogenase family)
MAAAATALTLGFLARETLAKRREVDVHGKVALITGGSRGLGLALSRELARQGCRLAICARDEAELAAARIDLEQRGTEVLVIPCDVADKAQVSAMIEAVMRHYGQIDILVNNAGIIVVAPLESLTHADFDRVMDINFWGVVNPTLAVLPSMRARRSGRIVNITSIGGKVAVPHLLPYTCAKFAAVGFSHGLRAEVAADGITVTTVVPGLMRTGSFLHAEFGGDQEAEYRWFAIGSSAPYPVTTAADHAARTIVRAAKRGLAECTYPVSALAAARVAGLLPGVTASTLELVDRLLPEPSGDNLTRVPGATVEERHPSALIRAATALGREAANELNQGRVPSR